MPAATAAQSPASPAPATAAAPPAPAAPQAAAGFDTGETQPAAVSPGGPLDRAHVKRAWPAVLAEFRKLKPSRAGAFANTEVDVDGGTLVIEFPVDAALHVPSQPETREVLARALGVVLGAVPPFRYQEGRGAVVAVSEQAADMGAPETDAMAAGHVATAPVEPKTVQMNDEVPEAPVDVQPTPAAPSGTEDLDEIMRTQFGAEMVAEHPHDPATEKDGA